MSALAEVKLGQLSGKPSPAGRRAAAVAGRASSVPVTHDQVLSSGFGQEESSTLHVRRAYGIYRVVEAEDCNACTTRRADQRCVVPDEAG
jgi:hypothetical protein